MSAHDVGIGLSGCEDPDLRQDSIPYTETCVGPDWAEQIDYDPTTQDPHGRGVVVEDFDGDGVLDIFLPAMGPDQLFFGTRDQEWEDRGPSFWPSTVEPTMGAAAADYDGDGDLDLAVANRGAPNRLYKSDGHGRFSVDNDAPLEESDWGTTTVSWGDLDGDGDLDLLLGGHATHHDASSGDPSELYENLGNGRFENRSDLLSDRVHAGYTYAIGLFDLDGDLDLDPYFVNDFANADTPNTLLWNVSGENGLAFLEATGTEGLGVALQGTGLGVGDVNGDGTPDLLVTSWQELLLLERCTLSSGEPFWNDNAPSRGITWQEASKVAWGADLADLNNDGLLDAMIAFGHFNNQIASPSSPALQPDMLFVQEEDGTFENLTEMWQVDHPGMGRGFALADLNADGFLDMVSVALGESARVYMSQCGKNAWLQVRLRQEGMNSRGVGARVDLWAGGEKQVRWITAGGTNLASSGPLLAHFGIGEREHVERVVVTWPDGAVTERVDVSARQTLIIER